MNKFILLFVSLFVTTLVCKSQASGDLFVRSVGFIKELKSLSQVRERSTYLNEQWTSHDFSLRNGEKVDGVVARFDVENFLFEIKIDDEIKVLPGELVTIVKITDVQTGYESLYISTDQLNQASVVYRGFWQILGSAEVDKPIAISKIDMEVLPPTYNAALDIGEKNEKSVLKETMYMLGNDEIIEITGSKKKNIIMFGDHIATMRGHIKSEGLSFKFKPDVIKMINHYLELLKAP